jgi:hypothetical protein
MIEKDNYWQGFLRGIYSTLLAQLLLLVVFGSKAVVAVAVAVGVVVSVWLLFWESKPPRQSQNAARQSN